MAGLVRRLVVKAGMWAAAIVEIEIPPERGERVRHPVTGAQVHLLVFRRPPKPVDEEVVPSCAFVVHADLDRVRRQHAGEGGPRELRALIGVEDFGLSVGRQGLLKCLDAEGGPHALYERFETPPPDLAPIAVAACCGGNKPNECRQAALHTRTQSPASARRSCRAAP